MSIMIPHLCTTSKWIIILEKWWYFEVYTGLMKLHFRVDTKSSLYARVEKPYQRTRSMTGFISNILRVCLKNNVILLCTLGCLK